MPWPLGLDDDVPLETGCCPHPCLLEGGYYPAFTLFPQVPQATPNGALDYGNYYSTWADPAVFQRVSAELRDRHLAWQAKKQPWSGDYAPITPLDPNNHVYKF
ncbi:unnamed protein product [Durusdinium trenchii]|uniref:Uncharacterized protein n=1 Tax=Durusdinium trenchii TaxID=1381693 RepID=A0ABP0LMR4_9DINO